MWETHVGLPEPWTTLVVTQDSRGFSDDLSQQETSRLFEYIKKKKFFIFK